MKIIDVSRPPKEIWLGRDGENNWRPIAFECATWLEKNPDGIITVWMQANGSKFPLSTDMDGTKAVWYPQQEELFLGGSRIEVSVQSGDHVGTSAIIDCCVNESLIGNGEHPAQTAPPWTVQVVADVTEQAVRAEEAAERAEEAGGDVSPEAIAEAIEDYFDEHPIDVPTDAVLYTEQSLTPAQQEQARENIQTPSSATLAAMLIPILREGLYGTDQTAAISALEEALGGEIEPEDPIETVSAELTEGYVNPSNGSVGGTASYRHTQIIPVREGDKVYGTCKDANNNMQQINQVQVRFTAAYDENGEIYPNGGSSTETIYKEASPFVVPAGVYGVVFSIINRYANDVVMYVDKSERVGA